MKRKEKELHIRLMDKFHHLRRIINSVQERIYFKFSIPQNFYVRPHLNNCSVILTLFYSPHKFITQS